MARDVWDQQEVVIKFEEITKVRIIYQPLILKYHLAVPGTVLSILNIVILLIFATVLWNRYHCYFHFIKKLKHREIVLLA